MGTYSSSAKYASDAKSLEALKMLPSPMYLRLIYTLELFVRCADYKSNDETVAM